MAGSSDLDFTDRPCLRLSVSVGELVTGLDFTATKSQSVFCSSAHTPCVVERWIHDAPAGGVVCLAQCFQNGFDSARHRPFHTASNLLGHQVIHRG